MSEEVAQAAADLETLRQLRAALEVAHQELDAQREANRKAAIEIARLMAAMRQAARMFTIMGARKIIEQTIGAEP
jgi:tRNA threonylcarbamoyladenosine modification (KEOPS) complex Cgi121 subunit